MFGFQQFEKNIKIQNKISNSLTCSHTLSYSSPFNVLCISLLPFSLYTGLSLWYIYSTIVPWFRFYNCVWRLSCSLKEFKRAYILISDTYHILNNILYYLYYVIIITHILFVQNIFSNNFSYICSLCFTTI